MTESRMNILIVDDHESTREFLGDFIKAEFPDAEVSGCATLGAALILMSFADVILCDGHFPAPGYPQNIAEEPWRTVLSAAHGRPWALITGDIELAARARREGLIVFEKPFKFDAVEDFLRRAVRQLSDRKMVKESLRVLAEENSAI